jgi:hypothetical protein
MRLPPAREARPLTRSAAAPWIAAFGASDGFQALGLTLPPRPSRPDVLNRNPFGLATGNPPGQGRRSRRSRRCARLTARISRGVEIGLIGRRVTDRTGTRHGPREIRIQSTVRMPGASATFRRVSDLQTRVSSRWAGRGRSRRPGALVGDGPIPVHAPGTGPRRGPVDDPPPARARSGRRRGHRGSPPLGRLDAGAGLVRSPVE